MSGVMDSADVKDEVLSRVKSGEYADLVPHLKLLPNHERAGVIVTSGHHVLLKNGLVCLFIGCFHRTCKANKLAVDCVFLPLEPFREVAVVPLPKRPSRSLRSASHSEEGAAPTKLSWAQKYDACRHPGAKLPWLKRRHASYFQIGPSSVVRFKVLVQPALAVGAFARITNEGHLLVHDIFNFDGLRQEEIPT